MDPLVVGAAGRDDDGGLVPDLAPDSGGGVGLGVAGLPARSCVGTVALMLIPAEPAGKSQRVVPFGPPARWSWTQPCPWSWIAVVAQ